MLHIIKETNFENVIGTSYHDWIIRASKTEIEKKLRIKPKYFRTGKFHYNWDLILDDNFAFSIYDMSGGKKLGKDDVIEFHLGWKSAEIEDIENERFIWFNDDCGKFPKTRGAIELIEALEERGLDVDHSNTWYMYYGPRYNATNKEELLYNEDKEFVKQNIKL